MKQIFSFLLFSILCCSVFSQNATNPVEKKSTLVIKKTGSIRAKYDYTNQKLIAVDGYGNVFDTSIISYKVSFRLKGVLKTLFLVNRRDTFNIMNADANTEVLFESILFRKKDQSEVILPSITLTRTEPDY